MRRHGQSLPKDSQIRAGVLAGSLPVTARLLRAALILPGNVLIVVPTALLWLTRDTGWAAAPPGARHWSFVPALVLGAFGAALAIWTVHLFLTEGRGTPAPWDPPLKLVVRGPYRHVRNPMITGVLCLLCAEALLLGSNAIGLWLATFFILTQLYHPLVEEKGLEARFGADYREYKANVPRWLPRLKPWSAPPYGNDITTKQEAP